MGIIRKAVVNETFITTVCILIVRVEASQLYQYSMCQNMPTDRTVYEMRVRHRYAEIQSYT